VDVAAVPVDESALATQEPVEVEKAKKKGKKGKP